MYRTLCLVQWSYLRFILSYIHLQNTVYLLFPHKNRPTGPLVQAVWPVLLAWLVW